MEPTRPLREASLLSDKAKNSPASGDYTLSMPGGGSGGTGFRAEPASREPQVSAAGSHHWGTFRMKRGV